MDIDISVDLKEAQRKLDEISKEAPNIINSLLSGIGQIVLKNIKREYAKYLNVGTGKLVGALIKKLDRKNSQVVIYSPARRGNQFARYGFMLARGGVILPKKVKFLTFQINGEWKRSHAVVLPKRPWLSDPASEVMNSGSTNRYIDSFLQKKIKKIMESK